MRRISILITILVTSFAMALSGLAISPANASVPAAGTYACGSGTYKITTAGSVTTFSDASTCTGDVVIPEGVTTTTQYVFGFGDSQVTSVSLPESLNQIGLSAFYGTGLLTEINVASNNLAFASVGGVLFRLNEASATLFAYPGSKVESTYTTPATVSFAGGSPKPVTRIENYALQGAKNLTTLNISEGVTGLGYGIAETATLLSTINLPDSYTAMTEKPLAGATGLTAVTIGEFLTSIQEGSFGQTGNLNSINVASTNAAFASVGGVLFRLNEASASLLAYPGSKVESTYTTPTSVSFAGGSPIPVTRIETNALQGAKNLTTLNISEGVTTLGYGIAQSATLLSTINLPDSYTAMTGMPLASATGLTALTIGEFLTSIQEGSFSETGNLNSITVHPDNSSYSSSLDGVLFNDDLTVLIAYPVGKPAASYTIPSGVGTVDKKSFQAASKLTSVIFPSSISAIESEAFSCASYLTSFIFQGNAPTVGNFAFGCITDPKAYIKSGNTTFTLDVDGKWNGLTVSEFDHFVSFDSKGGSAVSLSSFLTGGSVSAPTAPTRDFYGFTGWSTTNSVAEGGTAVTFPYTPSGDITLFANWFKDGNYFCSTGVWTEDSTDTYMVTGGVVSNGSACTGDVDIPEGVTQIGTSAFAGSAITAIDLPASVTYIAQGAFFNSTLESVAFEPNGNLQTIGLEAFRMTKLISISIPEGVKTIEESAFNYIPTLTSVTIPSSIITIDGYNFYASASLNSVFFLGDAPASVGENVFTEIGPSPKAYVNAANASSFTIGDDGKWKGLTVVDLAPDGTYDCSTGALTGSTTNIFSILGGVVTGGTCTGPMVIPSGVVAIGPYAFQEQTTLTSITFSGSSNLKSIGVNAFFGATGLTSVVIPDGVTSIGDTAFYGTSSLTSVTFEGNDTSPPLNIGYGAFYNAIKLTSISIPKNVISIGNNAFDTTTSLTSVTFAEGSLLTSIGNSAFAYAPKLTSITIPENVESIGTNAFEAATSLASVYFSGNAPTVGDNAFLGSVLNQRHTLNRPLQGLTWMKLQVNGMA